MLLLALALAADLTVARIVSKSPSLTGTAPSAVAWSKDSRQVAFLWNDQGMPPLDVWAADRDGGAPRRITRDGATGFVWKGGELVATSDRSTLGISPDGTTLSFLRDGDLWLVCDGTEVRATHVAVPSISAVPLGRYYGPDVEIGGAQWGESSRYAWSPDGRTIAVHYVDRRGVRKFPIPWYLGDDAILNLLRRGAPGDVNELRTVGLLDVQTLQLKLLDLPNPSGMRIIGFAWSQQGELLIDRETDDCVDRSLFVTGAQGGPPREVWHDHGEGRIYNDVASAWAADGKSVLLTGDLDDRYRLYSVRDGKAELLTPGPSDVEGAAIARASGIFYVSSAPRPEERHVWRVGAKGPVQVTSRPGVHTPFVSPDGKTIALLSTDDATPAELWLLDVGTGRERQVTHSPPAEFAQYPWARARYVQFPSSTAGVPLHARIFVPPTPGKHPVIFGPSYTNRVRNRWDARWGLLEQLLVQRGYVVVALDSRGSTGYGRAFREKFLFGWGSGDLDDYEDAVKFVRTLPEVDPARIGVFGSSYGGLITVHALFKKPGLFRAGVAAAPAVDPRYYGSDDVAIVRTPRQHPDWFTLGKAAPFAKNLRDHLMIIHGMADDVVPFQTSVQLAEQLIKDGKEFDFVVAPGATHAWAAREDDAKYLFDKLIAHFDRWLKGPQ